MPPGNGLGWLSPLEEARKCILTFGSSSKSMILYQYIAQCISSVHHHSSTCETLRVSNMFVYPVKRIEPALTSVSNSSSRLMRTNQSDSFKDRESTNLVVDFPVGDIVPRIFLSGIRIIVAGILLTLLTLIEDLEANALS